MTAPPWQLRRLSFVRPCAPAAASVRPWPPAPGPLLQRRVPAAAPPLPHHHRGEHTALQQVPHPTGGRLHPEPEPTPGLIEPGRRELGLHLHCASGHEHHLNGP